MRRAGLVALAGLAGCSSAPRQPPPAPAPPMLAALPKPAAVNTARFAGIIVCDRCHTAGAKAMRDSKGRDISPVTELRASMMGLAARDPYYLAALRRELIANPGAKAAIEATCNRCHAPVGFAESGGTLTLDELIAGSSPAAILGREGVGCAGCHALDPAGLGEDRSFTGQLTLRGDRVAFGALPEPLADAMVAMSKTRPVPSPHVSQSRLCASCHTVLVHRLDARGRPVGDELPEQTTYLEWRNSEFQDEVEPHGARATTCQGCHMPRGEDERGEAPPIATAFATRPPDAPVRPHYRRHALRGGNAYLLERLAVHADWLGAKAGGAQLLAAAVATRAFLLGAARLEIAGTREALAITVVNLTGHKLPTGYPSRRMWLHVQVVDAYGETVFATGSFDRAGVLVDGRGERIDGPGAILPHRTRIDSPDQVIVWEAVPVDPAGKRTHLLLGTAAIVKDNRILPAGWRADHPDAPRTRPIGVDGDPDFAPGRDTVTLVLPATAHRVFATLLYQPIPPETIESYDPRASREAARFRRITADPPRPLVLARSSFQVP